MPKHYAISADLSGPKLVQSPNSAYPGGIRKNWKHTETCQSLKLKVINPDVDPQNIEFL
jgi:hypothetical protein